MRVIVTMACTECKRRNYTTEKSKTTDPDRIEFNKYCKWCRKHTLHRETR
jgi:large subunit ribosomal protein L33